MRKESKAGQIYKKHISRGVLVLLAILIQLAVLLDVISNLDSKINIIRYGQIAFRYGQIGLAFLLVISVINREMTTDAKIPWVILIILFPLAGGIFYIFFSGNRLNKRDSILYQEAFENVRKYSHAGRMEVDEFIKYCGPYFGQTTYIYHSTGYVSYRNTRTTFFPLGEIFHKSLLDALRSAEKFIFMEYFIIGNGKMWNDILSILTEKASEGVEVRLIYDDVGCIATLPEFYPRYLEKRGIKVTRFNPFMPVISEVHNNRDHRKITVIDGKVGFIGGANLADEYINLTHPYGHWKDTTIKLEGPGVAGLTLMFLQSHEVQSGEKEKYSDYMINAPKYRTPGIVFPFGDGPKPAYKEYIAENVYLNFIYQSRNYLWITTPYLVPDSRLINALKVAAKRGVDVRIVTPGIPDKKFVYMITRSNYQRLQEDGVKIYEYTPGFIHAKQMICDDNAAIIGTINLDYRSMVHHFECGVWMYNTETIIDIKKDFEEIFKVSENKQDYKQATPLKWVSRVAQAFTPLL